jgi:nitrile hydratase subunit beta
VNGIHDLGGMSGFGPVDAEPERSEPNFHADWEPAVLSGMFGTLRLGRWSIDEFRLTIESSPPLEYLRRSYYEKWLVALEELVVTHGLVTAEELATGRAAEPVVPDDDPWRPSFDPPARPPRFVAGEGVRARNRHPSGHTREPRYVRGRVGTVVRHVGGEPLPEDAARGVCTPEHVYLVRFDAHELWGPDAAGDDAVYLELWESYLEPLS